MAAFLEGIEQVEDAGCSQVLVGCTLDPHKKDVASFEGCGSGGLRSIQAPT